MKKIKCVVFDLDNTLWSGILMENESVEIKEDMIKLIQTLDQRGILLSIASKGDFDLALKKLKNEGLDTMFLYPQVSWNKKFVSLKNLSKKLNISLDTFAFIDDDDYELEEMKFYLPEVECVKSSQAYMVLDLPRYNYDYYSEISSNRRKFYQADEKFMCDREKYNNCMDDFFQKLNMKIVIENAEINDKERLCELLVRTSKFNTVGTDCKVDVIFKEKRILKIKYEDIYCDYGIVGVLIIKEEKKKAIFDAICFSCRMISRKIYVPVLKEVINYLKGKYTDIYVKVSNRQENCIMRLLLKEIGFLVTENCDQYWLYKLDNQTYNSKQEKNINIVLDY